MASGAALSNRWDPRSRLLLALALSLGACVVLVTPRRALGQDPDPIAAAHEAYSRGARAYDAGRYAEAVDDLARADELVPNAVVLELALHAVLMADDPVVGMSLVERAEGRAAEGALGELAARAREKFESRVGQLKIACPAQTACRATVDGTAASTGASRWMPAGDHVVELFVEGATERRSVHIDPGARVELTPLLPTAPPPASAAPSRGSVQRSSVRRRPKEPSESEGQGISPAWFWIGVGATALVGGGTVASGVDAANKRSEFLDGPSDETEAAGKSAQLRTNVLLAVTGAVAIGTLALGIVTFWRPTSAPGRPTALQPSSSGAHGYARGPVSFSLSTSGTVPSLTARY